MSSSVQVPALVQRGASVCCFCRDFCRSVFLKRSSESPPPRGRRPPGPGNGVQPEVQHPRALSSAAFSDLGSGRAVRRGDGELHQTQSSLLTFCSTPSIMTNRSGGVVGRPLPPPTQLGIRFAGAWPRAGVSFLGLCPVGVCRAQRDPRV